MGTKQLQDERVQYAIWLGLPPEGKESLGAKNDAEFSKKFGVSTVSLSNWKKDPQIQSIASNAVKLLSGTEMYAITAVLVRKCMDGDVRAIELFYKLQNKLKQDDAEGIIGAASITYKSGKKS